jgi:hypothetical protein
MKKIEPQEIQLRLETYVYDIINQIFPGNDVFNKLKSTTAKYWVKQNIWKMDNILNNFVDKDGLIDIEETINFYVDSMFDENSLDRLGRATSASALTALAVRTGVPCCRRALN